MFDMKTTTLITILALASTPQAQAAKLISRASANTAVSATAATEITSKAQATEPGYPVRIAAAETVTRSSAPGVTAPAKTGPVTGIATGFYLGAQLGDSSVGAVMGYQFTKMVGMEISYDYFDPIYTRATTTTIAEKNRLGASSLWMFPVRFSDMGPMALYVKVGYARTTDKLTTNDPGLPPSTQPSTFITTTTKTGVTGGAGVHVDVSQSATVRLGVNVVGAERTTYLAALYRF